MQDGADLALALAETHHLECCGSSLRDRDFSTRGTFRRSGT